MTDPITVLVVEDNDFVRMQVARFLQDEGYTVVEASDGAAALDLIKVHKVAVAIVDIRMEPMDGFELIKALHSQSINLPIVLVTGDNNPDLLSEAARWHVSAVLMKPVQKDRLIKMVSRAIQQSGKKPPSS